MSKERFGKAWSVNRPERADQRIAMLPADFTVFVTAPMVESRL
jgi:hypothetical protein